MNEPSWKRSDIARRFVDLTRVYQSKDDGLSRWGVFLASSGLNSLVRLALRAYLIKLNEIGHRVGS